MITEEAFVDFQCPYCSEPVSFPQLSAGSLQACPNCNEAFIIPSDPAKDNGKVPLPVEAKAVLLRRLTHHDWRELLGLVSDEELHRFARFPAYNEEGVLRWLESDHHLKITTPNETFWLGIELKESKKLIGLIGLGLTQDEHRQAQITTIVLAGAFQGKGYALESVEALLQFCFEKINLHRVFASCDHRNAAGLKLFERLGLRREGEFIKDRWVEGDWANTVWFAALRDEYLEAGQA